MWQSSSLCLVVVAIVFHMASASKNVYYQYGYEISDPYGHGRFGHMEIKKDYGKVGEYKVALPDGRIQITSYLADDAGYRPTIAYKYPRYEQAHHKRHAQGSDGPDLFLIGVRDHQDKKRFLVLSKRGH